MSADIAFFLLTPGRSIIIWVEYFIKDLNLRSYPMHFGEEYGISCISQRVKALDKTRVVVNPQAGDHILKAIWAVGI